MTKQDYFEALESELRTRFAWAQDDEVKLARYMAAAREKVLCDSGPSYQYDGAASKAAWQSIGGKGTPTLTALRALPAN